MAQIDEYFKLMVEKGASDLHLSATCVPKIRESGTIVDIEGKTTLTGEDIYKLMVEIMPERNKKEFDETGDSDFAYELEGYGRYGAHILRAFARAVR